MNLDRSFAAASADIAHEAIEGEVVIVNLANGAYYSTVGTGADVWNLLVAGRPAAAVAGAIAARYGAPAAEVATKVEEMIELLLQEGLLVPAPDAARGAAADEPITLIAPALSVPTVVKYSDMEDLLLLDPIHEVEESAGWPNKA